MDQTAAEIRLSQWEQIVLEANNSGIPKNEWCKQNGISIKAFYYWQRKIRNKAAASMAPAAVPAVPVARSAFVELAVTADPVAPAKEPPQPEFIPEILLQVGDCRLFIAGSVRKQTLNTVMQVIRNA